MKSDIDQNLMPLSIRKLDLENDFPLLYEWLRNEYISQDNPAEFNYESLLESYQLNEDSSFAESCMVWLDEVIPVMEVDISKGDMHEISSFYAAKPHDYVLRLQLPPQPDTQLIKSGLQLIIQYCFTVKKAKKLVVPVYIRDVVQKSLLGDSGFTCNSTNLYKDAYSLYVLDKYSRK